MYLLAGLAFALIIIVLYLFLPVFNVNNIIILGNSKMTKEEIISKSNVDFEKNPYLIDKTSIKNNFKLDPYVESIDVKPKFPDTLIYNIGKRQAVASLKFTGGFIIIDENGIVLESTQEMSNIVKPLINGIEVTEIILGEKLEPKNEEGFALILNIISNIKSAKLLNNISQIEISETKEITMVTPHGIKVLLGNGGDLNEKMLQLNHILIDLYEKKIYSGYVDMRYDSYPVYRKEK